MKRRIVLMFASLSLVAVTAFAQSKDFNGTWVLDKTKSGEAYGPPTVKITMTAKSISLQPVAEKEVKELVFNLDGTETELALGGKGKAEWKGAKLVLTMVGPRGGPQTMTWSREGDMLVNEMQTSHGPEKTYYKRQPAR